MKKQVSVFFGPLCTIPTYGIGTRVLDKIFDRVVEQENAQFAVRVFRLCYCYCLTLYIISAM